jgi:hypothetical protein
VPFEKPQVQPGTRGIENRLEEWMHGITLSHGEVGLAECTRVSLNVG